MDYHALTKKCDGMCDSCECPPSRGELVTCGGGLPGDPNGEQAALAVEVLVRETHEFQGRYKGFDLDLMRDGPFSRWYIRVRDPRGCYAYDGWWAESGGKSVDDAIAEALRGACLWTPNAKLTGPQRPMENDR